MQNNPNSEYRIPKTTYASEALVNDATAERQIQPSSYGLYAFFDNNENAREQLKVSAEKPVDPTILRLNEVCKNIETARLEKLNNQPRQTPRSRKVRVFIGDFAKVFFKRDLSEESFKAHSKNELIAMESAIGASVFGLKTDEYNRNEFFCEGRDASGVDSWFFHQESFNPSTGKKSSRTLHYEVMPSGVLLVGHDYLRSEELKKFIIATEMYYELVIKKLYSGVDTETSKHRSGKQAA